MFMVPFNNFLSDNSSLLDFGPDKSFSNFFENSSSMLKTDVEEKDNSYVVTMDVPGMNKDNVKIEVDDGMMTVTVSNDVSTEEKDSKGNYIRRERRTGTFTRSFSVNKDLQASDVTATCENGVLTMTLPKPAEAPKKSTSVQIN